ncbi:hypothetical protein AJ88_31985 [Mesorhizobium amorphae CCBAU 01583]|nr:hypothetical protein AJ88_31985 [Mesorhizobium amorphae CCBAU 01583]
MRFDNPIDALPAIAEALSKMQGEMAAFKLIARRLMLIGVLPHRDLALAWDSSIQADKDVWVSRLAAINPDDEALASMRLVFESAIAGLDQFLSASFDPERPTFKIIEGGKRTTDQAPALCWLAVVCPQCGKIVWDDSH